MKHSTDRILTTHTGSLPLPALVRQALAAKRRGEAYDQAVIDAALTTAIGEVAGLPLHRLGPCTGSKRIAGTSKP